MSSNTKRKHPNCAFARGSRHCRLLRAQPRLSLSTPAKASPRYKQLHANDFRLFTPKHVAPVDSLFVAVAYAFGLWVYGKPLPPGAQKSVASNMRKAVVTAVLENESLQQKVMKTKDPQYRAQFKYNAKFWALYKPHMERQGIAGPAEIRALAKLMNVVIHVYDPSLRLLEVYKPQNEKLNKFVALLRVVRISPQVYSALIPTHTRPASVRPPMSSRKNNNTNKNSEFDPDSDEEE